MKSRAFVAIGAVVGLAVAHPASAAPQTAIAESYRTVPSVSGGGPRDLDNIQVLEVGPKTAKRVLILLAGWYGGAGSLRLVAEGIAEHAPSTQVWAMERREQNLERRGEMSKGQNAASAPFVRQWGLALGLRDIRAVVKAASDHGRRKVFLGGHSWGATTAMAYAGWDFDGHAGYRDLAGLVLIDGGVHDSFAGEGDTFRLTEDQAKARLHTIETGDPFDNGLSQLVGSHAPEAAAVFIKAAGARAIAAPEQVSDLAAALPKGLGPDQAITNRALLGWMFDAHPAVADLRIHSGRLSAVGSGPIDWIDDGPAPIARVAALFAGDQPFAFEWYWPKRLTLDLEAIDPFTQTPATSALGFRLTHGREIDIPLYVVSTGLTHGTVLTSARWVVGQSKITLADYQEDPAMGHLDPLLDPYEHNKFLQTVVPFLAKAG